jgi:hypothetical protein
MNQPSRLTLAAIAFALATPAALVGCSRGMSRSADESAASTPASPAAMATSAASAAGPGGGGTAGKDGDDKQAPASQRRVIRKADVSLESDAPDTIQAALTSLAAARGGFVVGADTTRTRESDGAEDIQTTVTFRVPATQFDPTLTALHALGKRVASEKVTGEDVTEEYVDLEARIRARRALEEQYMTILKEAKTIPDILAVEQKLGEVRSEIERAEGRRRFLENQSDLSTFTVHVARHIEAPPEDTGPGFGKSVKSAAHDAVTVSIAIVNGLIRALGVLVPLGVIIVLPVYLLVRWWLAARRRKRDAG